MYRDQVEGGYWVYINTTSYTGINLRSIKCKPYCNVVGEPIYIMMVDGPGGSLPTFYQKDLFQAKFPNKTKPGKESFNNVTSINYKVIITLN